MGDAEIGDRDVFGGAAQARAPRNIRAHVPRSPCRPAREARAPPFPSPPRARFPPLAMNRRDIHKVAGAPLPKWTPERSIAVMDVNGVETAITSLSAPGVYFGNLAEARELARRCNEFAAEMRERYRGRFGSF